MKLLIRIISIAVILLFLGGCSSTDQSEESDVNSGVLDESYIGDADPELIEEYKQTEEDAQIQADVLEKIEEEGSDTDGREINERL